MAVMIGTLPNAAAPAEANRSVAKDLDSIRAAELDDAAALFGREVGSRTAVDLDVTDPLTERLVADAERVAHPSDGSPLAALFSRLGDHPDGALSQLRWIALGAPGGAGGVRRGSIPQEMEPPSSPGRLGDCRGRAGRASSDSGPTSQTHGQRRLSVMARRSLWLLDWRGRLWADSTMGE
jgi:hypothetical protein